MKRLLFAYAIFAVCAIGFISFVNAEEYTVDVPFDYHGVSCSFDKMMIEYHCIWQGTREAMTDEEMEQFRKDIAERLEAKDDRIIEKLNEEALEQAKIEQAKLTPNEKIIQEIENKLNRGVATATESVYMNLLKELDTCQQGMDRQTAPIQEAREFEISEFDNWKVNNVKYDGKLGEIVLAIEECRGQQALKKIVGEGYSNMPTGEADHQFSLTDIYTPDVRAVPYDKLTSTNRSIDMSAICDSNAFPDTHKAQHGCPVLYDGKTLEQIKRENEVRFGTDGKIKYESKVLDDYFDFLENSNFRYATDEDKEIEEAIAEPIAKEMIEANHFWKNANRE